MECLVLLNSPGGFGHERARTSLDAVFLRIDLVHVSLKHFLLLQSREHGLIVGSFFGSLISDLLGKIASFMNFLFW